MARQVLGRLDKIFGENSTDLHETIVNLKTFSGALSKNSGKIDTILGGLEKTFAAPAKPVMAIYDLNAPTNFPPLKQPPQAQLVVSDLTTILTFDTQQILLKPQQGSMRAIENAQWGDSLPKLVQEKIIQSFENAHYLGAVSRPLDRLAMPIISFSSICAPSTSRFRRAPHAEIEFTAKILAKDGKIIGARSSVRKRRRNRLDAAGATAALNAAFGKVGDRSRRLGRAFGLRDQAAKGKAVQGELQWPTAPVFWHCRRMILSGKPATFRGGSIGACL